jgi:DNA-binding PadR family transcriptional regulator
VGPRRRYYALTELGGTLLRQFAQRNVLIFREPAVVERLEALLGEEEESA